MGRLSMYLGIKVPRRLHPAFPLNLPGEGVQDYHITLVYLGKTLPSSTLGKVVEATWDTTERVKPFRATWDELGFFPQTDKGYPIFARVVSDPLVELRSRLVESLKSQGVVFPETFPTYNPHITLSFFKGDEVPVLPKLYVYGTFDVRHVTLWWGSRSLQFKLGPAS